MITVSEPVERLSTLVGLRILVVEDIALVAIEIRNILQRAQCEVVGPLSRLAGALQVVSDQGSRLDGALLDVNLHGDDVYPLAVTLQSLAIPIILMTGYGSESIPKSFRHLPRLLKPFDSAELLRKMAEVFGPRAPTLS